MEDFPPIRPEDLCLDTGTEPVIALELLVAAQTWAVLHPAADVATRRLLVERLALEIEGPGIR